MMFFLRFFFFLCSFGLSLDGFGFQMIDFKKNHGWNTQFYQIVQLWYHMFFVPWSNIELIPQQDLANEISVALLLLW